MKIELGGALDIQAALKELGDPKAVRRVVRKALKVSALPMVETARVLAPIDEGNLRASIKAEVGKGDQRTPGVTSFVLGIDADVQPAMYHPRQKPRKKASGRGWFGGRAIVADYWRDPGVAGVAWIKEFGTPTKKAQPFMRPAFDEEGEGTIRRFGELAGPEIERAAARLAKKRGGA